MPEISRFFGIVIKMFFDDHNPPHFHAEYSGDVALIDIRYYHRPKRGPKSPDKKRPLIEPDALWRLNAYFTKRLSYH